MPILYVEEDNAGSLDVLQGFEMMVDMKSTKTITMPTTTKIYARGCFNPVTKRAIEIMMVILISNKCESMYQI